MSGALDNIRIAADITCKNFTAECVKSGVLKNFADLRIQVAVRIVNARFRVSGACNPGTVKPSCQLSPLRCISISMSTLKWQAPEMIGACCKIQNTKKPNQVESLIPLSVGHRFLDLVLDLREVEACTRLHGWVVDRGLSQLGDLLLNEHEAPELEGPPFCCEQ